MACRSVSTSGPGLTACNMTPVERINGRKKKRGVGRGLGGTAHLHLVDFSSLRLSLEFVTSYLQRSHKCMRNKDVTGVSFAFGDDSGSLCCT